MKRKSSIVFAKEAIKYRSLLTKIPTIFRMIKMWISGKYTTNTVDIIVPILGILYIVSPIDLIPGVAIPFVGMVDDLAILSFILPKLRAEVEKFIAWEASQIKKIG